MATFEVEPVEAEAILSSPPTTVTGVVGAGVG